MQAVVGDALSIVRGQFATWRVLLCHAAIEELRITMFKADSKLFWVRW